MGARYSAQYHIFYLTQYLQQSYDIGTIIIIDILQMKKGDTGGLCNFPKIIKWGWNGNPALTNYSAQIRGQEVKIKLTQILKSVTSDNLSGISGYEYYRLL